jgi:hypothetical protein
LGRENFRSICFTNLGLLFGSEDGDVVLLIDCKGSHRSSPLFISLPMSFTFGIDDTHCSERNTKQGNSTDKISELSNAHGHWGDGKAMRTNWPASSARSQRASAAIMAISGFYMRRLAS